MSAPTSSCLLGRNRHDALNLHVRGFQEGPGKTGRALGEKLREVAPAADARFPHLWGSHIECFGDERIRSWRKFGKNANRPLRNDVSDSEITEMTK